jgi:lipoate-protein ligase A
MSPPLSLTARDVSTSLDMAKRVFAALDIYYDTTPRSAAMNMAIDEALLEYAKVPSIRFYRWDHAGLSFGYFGRFADVASYAAQRDVVRRWTGGGIVFHEDDLTYSIVITANDPVFAESSISIYENVHRALRNVLVATGQRAVVAAVADRGAASFNGHCFANPVRADVMLSGHKVAGGAQRRTRTALLHQGSIQHVDFENGLAERFAKELSEDCNVKILDESLIERAHELAEEKYGSVSWLRQR